MSAFTFTKSVMLGFLDTMSKTTLCSDRTDTQNEDILRAAIELLRSIADTRIARNRQHRNVLTSRLLQLPYEILSTIFEWVIQESPYKAMNTLRLVCSRFHWITESTPSLWSHIRFDSSQSNLGWTRAQLSRAMSAPLHISSPPKLQYDEIVGSWLELICGHVPRWESCEISISVMDMNMTIPYRGRVLDLIKRYLEKDEAPLLRNFSFAISISGYWLFSSPIRLFRGYAPRLRHLDLAVFPVTWDDPILSGLAHLGIVMHDSPTLRQYGLLLGSCPELETLSIEGASEDSIVPNTETFPLDVPLTKLKSLSFCYIPSSIVQSILCSIKASPDPIHITFSELHADARKLMLNPPQGSPIYDAYNTAYFMRLDMEDVSAVGIGPKDKYGKATTLTFVAEALESPLLLVQPILSSMSYCRPRIRALNLRGDFPLDAGSYTHGQLLNDLPELDTLELVGGRRLWHQEVINQLGTPMLGPDDASVSWLCPQLQGLGVENERYDLQNILAFVKARYAHSSGHHPTHLIALKVSGHIMATHDDVAEEIADLIGRDVFECEYRQLSASGIWEDC